MNRPSFNVLTEPWISVIHLNGLRQELGIVQCLEQAHELREIRDPAPIIEFGIYRLLVAFVLDMLILSNRRPEDIYDLKDIIREGRFDSGMIGKYIEQCGDVFDLFHPERPFLQTKMGNVKPKPLAGLFPATPSGTNVNHWHHEHEEKMTVTVQEAVRLITTIAPFMTAGGAGLSPSINGSPPIYALPMGRNLFETIIMNIPIRSEQESGEGVIAWRSDRLPGQERSQATTVEALTWKPRRIQLIPETDDKNKISVRKMIFEKGDSTRLNWIDASLAYRYDKDKVTPIRMRENRTLWRDAGPLLLLNDNEQGKFEEKVSFRRPDVVEQAFILTHSGELLMISVYGMRTDMKMKIFEWVKSLWVVPSNLGRSTRLGSLVQHELDRAEKAAFSLRNCIKSLYPREGAGNKKALGTLSNRCEHAFWQHLEVSFHPLMNSFAMLNSDAPDDPEIIEATANNWRDDIRNIAIEQFEIAAHDMDTDGDAIERQVHARIRLNNTLRKVLS
jgi:CRISPR system Cascade subunit CasA